MVCCNRNTLKLLKEDVIINFTGISESESNIYSIFYKLTTWTIYFANFTTDIYIYIYIYIYISYK